jgi:YfiH family protein
MRYADCVPLVFVDPVKQAIALAHAGWRGTLQRVAEKTVLGMQEHYGTQPAHLVVGSGPAISVDNYEVGQEVVAEVEGAFGSDAAVLLKDYDNNPHLDLTKANEFVLRQAGVAQVELSNLDTFSNPQDWFSHRASGGLTGRFGALLALGHA